MLRYRKHDFDGQSESKDLLLLYISLEANDSERLRETSKQLSVRYDKRKGFANMQYPIAGEFYQQSPNIPFGTYNPPREFQFSETTFIPPFYKERSWETIVNFAANNYGQKRNIKGGISERSACKNILRKNNFDQTSVFILLQLDFYNS